MKILMFFGLILIMSVVQGKHLHPRSLVRLGEIVVEDETNASNNDVDKTQIDVIRNVRPNRFVPINSILFFKTYPPCEEGSQRDLLGVCREVWD